MRGTTIMALAAATLWAAPAVAQSPFTGTWKVDEKAAKLSQKPNTVVLDGVTYACTTCAYPYKVAADGAFHAVPGNPFVDQVAVTVVDANTIRFRTQKGGKVMVDDTRTVQPDGLTVVSDGVDTGNPSGTPIHFHDTMKRVGAPGRGHRISGSWRSDTVSTQDEAGLTFTLAVTGKQVIYTTPTGERVEGMVGGPAVAWIGDPAGTTAAITMPTPATLRFSNRVAGKPQSVVDLAIAPDGRTLTITSSNVKRGTINTFEATKS